MMTRQQIIDVVTHFDKGGKVAAVSHKTQMRYDCENPAWNFDEFDYFPKPEPLTLWGVVDADGIGIIRPTKEAAENAMERIAGSPFTNVQVVKLIQAPE